MSARAALYHAVSQYCRSRIDAEHFHRPASGLRLSQLSSVDIEVGEDLGYVIQLLEYIHEPDHAFGIGTLDPNRVPGHHRQLGGVDAEAPASKRVLHRVQLERCGGDDVLITLPGEILCAAVEGRLERTVFLVACGVEIDLALTIEHPRDRVRRPQIATVSAEGMANFRHGPIGIVGGGFDEDGRTAGTVPLVGQLLVDAPLQLTSALLDGAVDILPRHVDRVGGIDRGSQARVAAGVSAPAPGSYSDLANHLGPGGGALRVGDRLLTLDLLPFAMAGHSRTPWGARDVEGFG